MSQVRPLRQSEAKRIALAVTDLGLQTDLLSVLTERGLEPALISSQEVPASTAVVGIVDDKLSNPSRIQALLDSCKAAARSSRPVVILANSHEPKDLIAYSFLRSAGAVLCSDIDVFIECLVLCAAFAVPVGPTSCIVAPPGSLLSLAADSLEHQQASDTRRARRYRDAGSAHVALVEASSLGSDSPSAVGETLVVPVSQRGELALGSISLVGLRAALEAVRLCGSVAQRAQTHLGPASDEDADHIEPDRERFARQLRKLGARAGDHECKVLLASYGIAVTRQAVATTPSGAARIAKQAGYPVDLKPWGPSQASEREGCSVYPNLGTAADVRRAFGLASAQTMGSSAIVRQSPPVGRELWARFFVERGLGACVLVQRPSGAPEAAPAPLSASDAALLCAPLVATRTGDRPINYKGLVELLVRASHLFCENQDVIEELELARIVASLEDEQVLVVHARATLKNS